jgi:molecular chaperone GrpE (heat shock protein)
MGAAAYNRGSRIVSREADEAMPAASARADRDATKAERARLLAQVASLEDQLARARRCIAELRRSKDARMAEAAADRSSGRAAIKILTRLAFPAPAPSRE